MNEMPTDPAEIYSKEYYDGYGKAPDGSTPAVPYDRDQPRWQNHFQRMAQILIERYRPRTTLDVGCAKGFLVEHLRDGGVEAFGLDVSPYAISQVREDIRPYCQVASGANAMSGQYDLITCIEMAEHMSESDARAMIAEMGKRSDQIIFSSIFDDLEDPTHINVHSADYWIALFQEQGFFPDRNFDPGFVTPQALRFLRCKKPMLQVAVFSHEPPNCAVALLRLAGIIRHLERQNRMQLTWHWIRDPDLDIKRLFDCDIFTIHREFCDSRIGASIIAAARELGRPLVFELDDLLINVPKTNPHHKYCGAITPDILTALRAADFITVTTEPLRCYLEKAEPQAKGKIYVLPNSINLDIWDGAKPPPEKPEDPFVVGWFGTATHDEDLAIIKPAIVELARKYPGKLVFKFWGYLPEDLKNIPGVVLVRGAQPDLRLHARDVVNSRIDLAVAPLSDHPFNHAKSDLKWLEYSICYIPGIYSTISPYTGSVAHGRTGWLVDNKPELWVEAIERFMRDHELRRAIAIQAHDEVRQKRCLEVGAEQWDALYRSFFVSGLKPRLSRNVTPRERALAFFTQYAANTLANRGKYPQALEMSQQAVVKCMPLDSGEGKLMSEVLRLYHTVMVRQEEASRLDALLRAAKSIAEGGHKPEALDLYRETLKTVLKSSNAFAVLRVVLEVARAYKTLDPEQGLKMIEVAASLAKTLDSKPDLQSVEQLRKEYARKAPVAAPPAKAKSNPSVSIIIPVFNNLSLTQACLESLRNTRTKTEYEIIVVDNASTDATAEYLKNLEKSGTVRVITNPSNKGFAHACNQGAQAAKAPQLLFLNNDTQVTEGWLDALTKAAGQSNVGVVGAKLLYSDGTIQHAGIEFIKGVPDHVHRRSAANLPAANKSRELDMVTGACLMTPRALFLKLSGFDETFRNGVEDIDYCLRVRALGRKVVYQPQSVVYHHEGQSAGRFDHVNENLKMFFGRWTNCFDKNFRYIVLSTAKTIAASQSLLLTGAPSAPLNPAKTVAVSWEGSFLDYGSLSQVNRELVGALKGTANIEIHCVAPGSSPGSATKNWPESAKEISTQPRPNAALTVRHAWPPNWRRPATGKLAVIQPWEFGSLPQEWVNNSPGVDEFWVPSAYVRDIYIASGVDAKKMVVVPNGVDAEKFHPQATPMKLATQKKFKFLFVGGTIGRKGPDLLLQAYLKNFTKTDDVCLVIKDFGGKSVYAGLTFEAQIRAAQSAPQAPEILYLNEELPPDLLPGLYTACNCFVLPYRGEGFGLPVLEAMACGLPVIVTAGGATDDFVVDTFAWRIPAIKKVFGQEVSGMKLAGDGWLLEPDLAALNEAMRTAFTSQDKCREHGQLASRHARENWSWEKSATIVAERIQELAASQSSPAMAAVKPAVKEAPSVAQIGRLNEARELFKQKKFEDAWKATLAAISKRPFHPDAYLLLAEIALAAGDAASAKLCAKRARDLAPGLASAKRILNNASKSSSQPQWLKLPEAIQNPPSQRLSVCLIAKNEEKFLAQCLKSIRDIAQQMIVVDTGSTDNTVAIAKELGAEVHSFKWCDDFSTARNVALEHATGNWILILDADEEIPAEQHSKLLADMKNSGVAAYRLPLVNRGQEANGRNFVPRLFRNAPSVYFFGRIHEQVFPSLMPLCKAWGLSTAMGNAEILHHGYTNEMMQDRNKVERNLKLLQQANTESPGDVILTMNLGLELVRSGNLSDGIARYREAFQLMSHLPPREITAESRETVLTQFTSQLYKTNAHHEVVEVLNSPLAKNGGLTASLHFALGLSLFALGNYEEAAEHIRHCLAKRKQPALSPINTDILTAMPNHCLALSLAKLNDKAGAEKAFETALAESGQSEEAKLDYAKFLAGENRQVEALHKLREMITANCRNVTAWRTGGEISLSRPDYLAFARDWTGEAIRYVAEDSTVIAQRAEALMLTGETSAAIEFWERLWNTERQPRALAALILCQAIESPTTHAPEEGAEELNVSRAFITWYQRLITMRSKTVISRLNEQMDKLSRALPTAAQKIGKALTEAQKPKAAA